MKSGKQRREEIKAKRLERLRVARASSATLDSRAVRCRLCRARERARVEEARRVSQAGLAKKLLEKQKNENA